MNARSLIAAVLSLVCAPASLVAQTEAPPPFDSSTEARSTEEARAAQQAWAAFLKRKVVGTNSIGMQLAFIPPGRFMMGSPPAEDRGFAQAETERQHVVTISKPFYFGVYEVTTTQFEAVTGQEAGLQFDGVDDSQFPVTWVTMEQVTEFLETLSKKEKRKYRLPTEAEWEYACRAGTRTAFWCGRTIDGDQLNCHAEEPYRGGKPGPYLSRPCDVGSFQANPFGLYDVHGNVAELCSDWYDENYYANSPERDPPGPERPQEDPEHLARGGGYHAGIGMQRSARRWSAHEDGQADQIGFRVVMELPEELLAKVPVPPDAPSSETTADAPADVPAEPDVPTELEGEWDVAEVTWNGKPPERIEDFRVTIRGRTMTFMLQGGTRTWLITVDPTQSPKHIDATDAEGGLAGVGIYEMSGDDLRICVRNSERPKDYETDNGQNGAEVYVLKRREAGAAEETPADEPPAEDEGASTVEIDPSAERVTAAEFHRTCSVREPGTLCVVSGVIAHFEIGNVTFEGTPLHSLELYGLPEEPNVMYGVNCYFASAAALKGLVEEQAIVVVGNASGNDLKNCRIVSRGELPERAPPPYEPVKREEIDSARMPAGVAIERWGTGVTFAPESISDDGSLPAAAVSLIKDNLLVHHAWVDGAIRQPGLEQLADLAGLRHLRLTGDDESARIDFSALAGLPRLRSLELIGSGRLTNAHLAQLGTFSCLAHLRVPNGYDGWDVSAIDDEGLEGLASLKSLRWLELPVDRGEKALAVTDAGLAALGKLPRLLYVDIHSQSIDGSGFSALQDCPELHTLNLSECSVTSQGLQSLASLPSLKVLRLEDTSVDSKLGTTVGDLGNLMHVNLRKTKIDDGFFSGWTGHATLEQLVLDYTTVGDATLDVLAANSFPRLRSLHLDGTKVTDAGVKRLANVKSLTHLSLPDGISDAVKAELHAALPDLKIY